jgi:hypothetical protein
MLLLELLKHFHLLLVIACWLAHLLLPLVVHHLLHHASRLAIQIAKFAILWCDLSSIDLGCRCDDMWPPLHLVDFVEVDIELLSASSDCLERPCGFIYEDGMWEGALIDHEHFDMFFDFWRGLHR